MESGIAQRPRSRREAAVHFIRYVMAGSVSVSVQFLVLTTLVEYLRLNPTLSSACGFIAGASTNYLLQYYFTFRARGNHLHTIPKYMAVNSTTLMINLGIFWTLTNILGLWYVASQACAICLVVSINFYLNRRWTFKHR